MVYECLNDGNRCDATLKMDSVPSLRPAVFLDRDGVLVHDHGFILREEQIRLMDGVAMALQSLQAAGMALVVVTNQAAIARGLLGEDELVQINIAIADRIERVGGPRLELFYYCPHHPDADLHVYRTACTCRKPRPGMLLRAADEHGLDLRASFLVGDRTSDIAAGAAAGCRTVLVTCGQHKAPPIVTVDPLVGCRPDHECADLLAASRWIRSQI
jgi:D-glycero-D-manno-heptose 1,7-bisphosphate phosphatase